MSSSRLKRLQKEVADVEKDSSRTGITIQTVDGSLDHLVGRFPGPTGTSYQGGTFEVDIVAPPEYPFSALKMKFITKIYHPNVSSQTGFICLDILKDAWSPVLTLKTALLSLQSLLTTPEPSDPQDAEVAKVYMNDRETFEETAKYWSEVYAGAPTTSKPSALSSTSKGPGSKTQSSSKPLRDEIKANRLDAAAVKQFVAMGFPQSKVVDAMVKLNWRGANAANLGEEAVLDELMS